MAKRTKSTRKTLAESKPMESAMVDHQEIASSNMSSPKSASLFSVRNVIVVLVIALLAVAWKMKGTFIAATVNGEPISRFELNDTLTKRYGSTTLDGMVNEKLILGAVQQKGVSISKDEIDKKVKEIEGRLNGSVSLKDALAAQGMTEEGFRRQVQIQLAIEKLFDKDASVTAQEVEEYIASNSASFQSATDPAQLKKDVTDILKQQKVNDLFQTWFENLKKDAKVQKFI